MALGIAVVAQAAAVTVGAVELWPAQAAASGITTLGEGPHGATATQLAEGEVEVAGGTAVTRGPLEACPAHALARVTITGSVHHARAGALAGCGSFRQALPWVPAALQSQFTICPAGNTCSPVSLWEEEGTG